MIGLLIFDVEKFSLNWISTLFKCNGCLSKFDAKKLLLDHITPSVLLYNNLIMCKLPNKQQQMRFLGIRKSEGSFRLDLS